MHLRRTLTALALAALVLSPLPSVYLSFDGVFSEQMVSHLFGAMSLMCMCLSMILSARPWGIDALFAGLDKAYVVHKWLGLSALTTLLIHDTLESEVDDLKSPVTLWGIDWHDLGSEMGVWVYNGILVLLAITFLRLVPYRWWLLTHRFMLALFVLSVAHFIVIPKPLALSDPGAVYIMGWSIFGLLAGLLALRPNAARGGVPYAVTKVQLFGDIRSVTLKPLGKANVRHRAGQFVFVKGTTPDLDEWHPFTISSAPDGTGMLRVTFAARGHWSKALGRNISVGDKLMLRGPHGRFYPAKGPRRQVWLSAGVGITPMLAWASDGTRPKGPVDILHICPKRDGVPHLEDLQRYVDGQEEMTLKVFETAIHGRPTTRDILRLLKDRDETVDLYFCGPEALENVTRDAIAQARKARFLWHSERFELRSKLPIPTWLQKSGQTLRDAAVDIWPNRIG